MSITPASPSLLESVFSHVVLPSRLPGAQERTTNQIECALTDLLLGASRTLRDLSNGEIYDRWDKIRHVLQTCQTVNAGGRLRKNSLLAEFRNLGPKDVLVMHIKEQNAGLLVHRHGE